MALQQVSIRTGIRDTGIGCDLWQGRTLIAAFEKGLIGSIQNTLLFSIGGAKHFSFMTVLLLTVRTIQEHYISVDQFGKDASMFFGKKAN